MSFFHLVYRGGTLSWKNLMQGCMSVGESEARSIRDSVSVGVRMDGRTLSQYRPIQCVTGAIAHMDGSCSVELDGTQVLVSLAVSVAETSDGEGSLRVHVDCPPAVSTVYAKQLGGYDPQMPRCFFSHLSNTVSRIFCAEELTLDDHGVADAVVDEEREDLMDDGSSTSLTTSHKRSVFPSEQLSLGHGFAFVVDADVQILKVDGGNLLGAICAGIRRALGTCKLPYASLHDTPSGVTVEVDRTRVWEKAHMVQWDRVPVVSVMHWTPERCYIIDPTLQEEFALPHRVIVASNERGRASYAVAETMPSRRGDGCCGIAHQDLRALILDGVATCDDVRFGFEGESVS